MSNDDENKRASSGADRSATEELSQRILDSLPSFTGEETKRWIINMKDEVDPANEAPKLSSGGKATEMRISTVALVDKMFDDFGRYYFEYNKSTSNPDLRINCQRPDEIKQDKTSGNWDATVIHCEGHLNTQKWALMVHAEPDKVVAYICPSDFVVGFKKRRRDFKPFAEIISRFEKGKQFWECDGYSVSYDVLPKLSKLIFEGLVRVARGEVSDQEPLSLGPKKKKETKAPPPPKPSFGGPDLYTADDGPDNAQAASNPVPPSSVASTASIAGARTAELYGAADSSTSLPQFTGDAGDVSSLLSAFNALVAAVDAHSNSLGQTGVNAMQSQDVVGVVQIMKRTAALKNLRQHLDEFQREWQKANSES